MANFVKCPECQKSLKLDAVFAGKRVRCPGCKHSFVAPAEEEPDEVLPADEEVPVKQSRRLAAEDDDDDDDVPRRPSKRKRRERDIVAPILPLIYGILSCLFSCVMPVGFALAWLAMTRADQAIGDLPDGSRSEAAEKNLRLARMLGIIGMCLSGVLLVVAIVLNIVSPVRH